MNSRKMRFVAVIAMLALLGATALPAAAQVVSINDFEDGTAQGWGGSFTNPPTNIATGGPDGADDNYLQVLSVGNGPGGKLVTFNQAAPWIGDFAALEIGTVQTMMNNPGLSALQMRVGIHGSGGAFVSQVVEVPGGSGWVLVEFDIRAASLVPVAAQNVFAAGTDAAATLASVDHFRFLHNASATFQGTPVTAELQLDNIALAAVDAECAGQAVTVDLNIGEKPTPGNDVILGTPGDDTIKARGGDDLVCGGLGDDIIVGGTGNDTIYGGDGADMIKGAGGIDTIFGGPGDDEIRGGAAADILNGQAGADMINGAAGPDMIDGGFGDDLVRGGLDNDSIIAGPGNDRAIGGSGTDTVNGGAGDDTLAGNTEDDVLIGSSGNDVLNGGAGSDSLDGGADNDACNGGVDVDPDTAVDCERLRNIP